MGWPYRCPQAQPTRRLRNCTRYRWPPCLGRPWIPAIGPHEEDPEEAITSASLPSDSISTYTAFGHAYFGVPAVYQQPFSHPPNFQSCGAFTPFFSCMQRGVRWGMSGRRLHIRGDDVIILLLAPLIISSFIICYVVSHGYPIILLPSVRNSDDSRLRMINNL
jgi:hypothetical protein